MFCLVLRNYVLIAFVAAQGFVGLCQAVPSCQYYKNFSRLGVPQDALKQALFYFDKHKNKLSLFKQYITIADYSKNSADKRFYLLDLKKMKVQSFKVSHGSGSVSGTKYGDPNHDGMLNRCLLEKDIAKKNGVHLRKK